MRLVLDTNVVISGLLWNGVPAELLEYARLGEIELFTSPRLLAELNNILGRAKFSKAIAGTQLPPSQLALSYAELASIVNSPSIKPTILADLSDDEVLATALAAKADLIVSGDKHLHTLGGENQGIAIARPADALKIISADQ